VAHEQNTCHASFISGVNACKRNVCHAPLISDYSSVSKCLLVSTCDVALERYRNLKPPVHCLKLLLGSWWGHIKEYSNNGSHHKSWGRFNLSSFSGSNGNINHGYVQHKDVLFIYMLLFIWCLKYTLLTNDSSFFFVKKLVPTYKGKYGLCIHCYHLQT